MKYIPISNTNIQASFYAINDASDMYVQVSNLKIGKLFDD